MMAMIAVIDEPWEEQWSQVRLMRIIEDCQRHSEDGVAAVNDLVVVDVTKGTKSCKKW